MLMWRYKGPTAEGVTYTHGDSSKYSPLNAVTRLRGMQLFNRYVHETACADTRDAMWAKLRKPYKKKPDQLTTLFIFQSVKIAKQKQFGTLFEAKLSRLIFKSNFSWTVKGHLALGRPWNSTGHFLRVTAETY